MKHICVFLAYQNFEHIKMSFESMYLDSIDYFIIENKSDKSNEIRNFFESKKLKGYIQFQKNIAANAVNIFIKDFYNLLMEYDIITITDGDLYIYNIQDAFLEIINNLLMPGVGISTISLFQDNNYLSSNRTIGIDNYINKQSTSLAGKIPTFIQNGNYLSSFKRDDLHILKNIYYQDVKIFEAFIQQNKKSVATSKNLAYHLTWDLYHDNNPYYQYKINVINHIWNILDTSDYIKII
jgi:hypothetical protein